MNRAALLVLAEAHMALKDGRARDLREAAHLSQSDVARTIGVRPNAVSRWEAELRTPRGEAGVRYGKLLMALADKIGQAA